MKNLLFTTFMSLLVCIVFAQKQNFDVVSFTIPKGWQQTKNESGIQLSVSDKNTGTYAVAVITKARASTATANENFSTDWLKLVKSSVQVNAEPTMEQPSRENGWDIISGGANYIDGGNTGMATLLTATGGNQTVSVVLMTNSKLYQNDLVAFSNSLQLSKLSQSSTSKTTITSSKVNSPLTGKIWEGTSSEKFTGAGAMTGHYTGGFSTVQYTFNANGTYRFVDVRASFYTDTKTIGYETGTYTISGNQLTINPVNGQNEEWSKVGKTSNGNSDVTNRAINETWGKKLKSNSRKLEKYTYSFSIGKNGDKNALVLQRNGRTERDGDGNTSYLNETSLERSVKLPGNIK